MSLQEILKWSLSSFFDPERLGDSGDNQVRIANGSQRDEADTVGKVIEQVSRYLQAQACFADTAGTRQGHKAHLWLLQKGTCRLYLLFSSNQWGELCRQVVVPGKVPLSWKLVEVIVARLLPITLSPVSHVCTSLQRQTDKCRLIYYTPLGGRISTLQMLDPERLK